MKELIINKIKSKWRMQTKMKYELGMKLCSLCLLTCFNNSRILSIGKERPGGDRDRSKEVRFRRMLCSIRWKHFTVEIPYCQSLSMDRPKFRSNYHYIVKAVEKNPSKFITNLGGIMRLRKLSPLRWLITFLPISVWIRFNICLVLIGYNFLGLYRLD